MSGMGAMSGMEMPGDKTPPTADPHAGHDMSGMPGMTMPDGAGGTMKHDMPGMDMQAAPGGQPMQHDMSSMPGMAMDGADGSPWRWWHQSHARQRPCTPTSYRQLCRPRLQKRRDGGFAYHAA
jgi:hypothetical protein